MMITLAFLTFIGLPLLMLVLSVGRTVFGSAADRPAQPRTAPRAAASKRPVTVIDAPPAEVGPPAPVPAVLKQALAHPVARDGEVVSFPRRVAAFPADEQHSNAG